MAKKNKNQVSSSSKKTKNSNSNKSDAKAKVAGKEDEIDLSDIPRFSIEEIRKEDDLLLSPEQTVREIVEGTRRKSMLGEWMPELNSEINQVSSNSNTSCADGNETNRTVNNPNNSIMSANLNLNSELISSTAVDNEANKTANDPSNNSSSELIEITMDDIAEEVAYWDLAVVLFVIGSNPKSGLVDGFSRRLWGKLNVDKIIPIKRGVFLIRFLNTETRDKALNMKNLMLDHNPVFLKQWTDGMNFDKTEFEKVPIWVNIYDLPLKYWGSLVKLLNSFGQPIKPDSATARRDRIHYARYLVEMNIKGDFPDYLVFKNENGVVVKYPVEYDWKPQICDNCSTMGHETSKCKWREGRKQQGKKKWVPKLQQQQQEMNSDPKEKPASSEKDETQKDRTDANQPSSDTEQNHESSNQGFVTVRRKIRKGSQVQQSESLVICNTFQELQEGQETQLQGQGRGCEHNPNPTDGQHNSLER